MSGQNGGETVQQDTINFTEVMKSYLAKDASLSAAELVERIRINFGVTISKSTAQKARFSFLTSRGHHPAPARDANGASVLSEKSKSIRDYLVKHPDAIDLQPAELLKKLREELKLDIDYKTMSNQRSWYMSKYSSKKMLVNRILPSLAAAATHKPASPGVWADDNPMVSLESLRLLRDAVTAVGGKRVAQKFIDLLP